MALFASSVWPFASAAILQWWVGNTCMCIARDKLAQASDDCGGGWPRSSRAGPSATSTNVGVPQGLTDIGVDWSGSYYHGRCCAGGNGLSGCSMPGISVGQRLFLFVSLPSHFGVVGSGRKSCLSLCIGDVGLFGSRLREGCGSHF